MTDKIEEATENELDNLVVFIKTNDKTVKEVLDDNDSNELRSLIEAVPISDLSDALLEERYDWVVVQDNKTKSRFFVSQDKEMKPFTDSQWTLELIKANG